jgi:hypothetical protein
LQFMCLMKWVRSNLLLLCCSKIGLCVHYGIWRGFFPVWLSGERCVPYSFMCVCVVLVEYSIWYFR